MKLFNEIIVPIFERMIKVKIIKVSGDVSLKRSVDSGTEEQRVAAKKIIADVRSQGDLAVIAYTEKLG